MLHSFIFEGIKNSIFRWQNASVQICYFLIQGVDLITWSTSWVIYGDYLWIVSKLREAVLSSKWRSNSRICNTKFYNSVDWFTGPFVSINVCVKWWCAAVLSIIFSDILEASRVHADTYISILFTIRYLRADSINVLYPSNTLNYCKLLWVRLIL